MPRGRPGCPAPLDAAVEPGSAASASCRTVAIRWAHLLTITSGEKNSAT